MEGESDTLTAAGEAANLQAAKALGIARAYPDLITALNNLAATTAQEDREIFAAQAAWLVVRIQAPADQSIQVLTQLFKLLTNGHPLQPFLAAAAMILVAARGKNHPEREKLSGEAGQLLFTAAMNDGLTNPEALPEWLEENRLGDPTYVVSQLLTRLGQFVGDRWLFDRALVQG